MYLFWKPGMVVHAFIPSTQDTEWTQEDYHEFEDSLDYLKSYQASQRYINKALSQGKIKHFCLSTLLGLNTRPNEV